MFTRFSGCDFFCGIRGKKNNIWIAESFQFGDGKSNDKIVLFECMNLTRMLLKLMNNRFCSRSLAAHTHLNWYDIRERDRDTIEIHANSFNQIKTIASKCMYHTQKVVKFMPSLNLVSAPEMIISAHLSLSNSIIICAEEFPFYEKRTCSFELRNKM